MSVTPHVIAQSEQEHGDIKIVALTVETGISQSNLLRLYDVQVVRPLRMEDHPSLAKVWDGVEDDDIFADL